MDERDYEIDEILKNEYAEISLAHNKPKLIKV